MPKSYHHAFSEFHAELHVHTVLSPCAAVEMIPPLIVERALERKINLIAITDHNHTANIAAVQKAAEGTALTVLPGMELQTSEEIHSLCLFDSLDQALELQKIVDSKLPNIQNNPAFFGEQFIVDETGDFIQRENRLLINSTALSLKEAWKIVIDLGGLFIPAHINRPTFGLLPTLGFPPSDISISIMEISRHISASEAYRQYPFLSKFKLIQGGDIHQLDDFLGKNVFIMANPTIAEMQNAWNNLDGRSFYLMP